MTMENHQTEIDELSTESIFEWEPIELKIYSEEYSFSMLPYWQYKQIIEDYVQMSMSRQLDNIDWRVSNAYDLHTKNSPPSYN